LFLQRPPLSSARVLTHDLRSIRAMSVFSSFKGLWNGALRQTYRPPPHAVSTTHGAPGELQTPRLPTVGDLLRKAILPLPEKGEVLLLAPEIIRKHNRDLLDYRIVAVTFRAEKDPLDDHFSVDVEFEKLERIVLVDRACEDVKELPLHGV